MFLRSIADLLLTAALLHLPLALSIEVYTTSFGGTCIDACRKENSNFYWCTQKGAKTRWWDYCSPEEGHDAYNRSCLSACQKVKGLNYEQCFTDNGWSKCGHVVEEFERYYTSGNVLCASECILHGNDFKCTDINGHEEQCSLLNEVTAKGEPCLSDHSCDLHGYDYTWCYVGTFGMFNIYNWDYCGKVVKDCEPKRNKRANGDEKVCRVRHTGNRRELVIKEVEVPESDFRQPSQAQFSEAFHLINTVDADFCFPNTAHTVATSENIRMDMQGTFERDGVRYMNVQLQLDEPRHGSSTRHSTTIAQILFPRDLDIAVFFRYIRRALQTSLLSAYHRPPVKVIISINPV